MDVSSVSRSLSHVPPKLELRHIFAQQRINAQMHPHTHTHHEIHHFFYTKTTLLLDVLRKTPIFCHLINKQSISSLTSEEEEEEIKRV